MKSRMFKTQAFAFMAMALVWATLGTGCGKKGDSQAAPPPPPPIISPGGNWGACTGCVGNSALIGSAVGRVLVQGQVGMELALEIYGDGNYMGQQAGYGGIGVSQYVGAVQATGYLRVYNSHSSGCFIPPGQYEVRTINAGQWFSQMSVANLVLEGYGPTQIRIELPNNFLNSAIPAVVSQDGRSFPFTIQNDARIYTVGNTVVNTQYGPLMNNCNSINATHMLF